MPINKKHQNQSFIKKHRFALVISLVTLIASGAFLGVAAYSFHKQTAALQTQSEKIAKASRDAVSKAKQQAARAQKARDTEAAAIDNVASTISLPESLVVEPPCSSSSPTCILVVVNKKHPLQPQTFMPDDLNMYNEAVLRKEAGEHFERMVEAAQAAGHHLSVTSSFRSYDNQVATYNHWVAVNGGTAQADTVSARPGYSEHQTGLVVDLKTGSCALECFGGTPVYAWLVEHAAEYGFIQRYKDGLQEITGYSPESWHWRYIGTHHATEMKKLGIKTLEEYLGVSGGDY